MNYYDVSMKVYDLSMLESTTSMRDYDISTKTFLEFLDDTAAFRRYCCILTNSDVYKTNSDVSMRDSAECLRDSNVSERYSAVAVTVTFPDLRCD